MFGLSWGEIAIILVVAVFLLGPERIPTVVQWVTTNLRKAKTMAAGAQDQLRGQLGPELEELRRQIADLQSLKEVQDLRSLRDLNPRNIIAKNVLGEEFAGGVGGFLGLNKMDKAGGIAGFLGLNDPAKPPEPAAETTNGAAGNGAATNGAAGNGAATDGAAGNGAAGNGAATNGSHTAGAPTNGAGGTTNDPALSTTGPHTSETPIDAVELELPVPNTRRPVVSIDKQTFSSPSSNGVSPPALYDSDAT